MEEYVLFNDALNTFYLRINGPRYGKKTTQIAKEKNRFRQYMGYAFRLAARAHTTTFITPVTEQ